MQPSKFNLSNAISGVKVRYLVIGSWNTIFGYCLGVSLFVLMNKHFHIVFIACVANIIAISMSFFTYKKFVFKTNGNWVSEYIRCYVVYGFNAVLGIFLLWFFVDIVRVNIWISQGLSILFTVFISFFLHKNFTFKSHTV